MIQTIMIFMVVYFGAMVFISYLGKKNADTYESYVSMGRSGGLILITGGAIGAHIGNGFVVGGAGEGAVVGLGGALYGIGCALSFVVMVLFHGKFVYKHGYLSLADFLRKRYNSKLPAVFYNLITTCSYLGIVGAQLLAGKALFEVLGLDGRIGVIAIALVVMVYSQIAGIWAAYATSVIHTVIIFLGLIITTIVLLATGGIGVIQNAVAAGTIPSTVFSPIGYDASTMVLLVVPTALYIFADQTTFQRVNAARSSQTSQRAHLLAALIMVPLAIMPAFVGLYGAAAFGVSGNQAFFQVALNVLPTFFTALVITAVVAAVTNTIDDVYVAFSVMLVKDIYKEYINPKVSDKQMRVMTLFLNIIVAAICITIALGSSSIVGLLSSTYVFTISGCLVPYLGGRLWKRGTGKGAIASIFVGVLVVFLNMIGILPMPFASVFPLLPAAAAYVIVSLLTPAEKAQEAVSAA